MDAIIAGVPGAQVKDKMIRLVARRQEIEGQLAAAEASPAPVRFHPKMSETYRTRVAALIHGLGEGDGMEEAREALRGLIDKIVLTPAAEGGGLTIDLHGALASLLRLATGASALMAAIPGSNTRMRKSSAGAEGHVVDIVVEIVLVAGTGLLEAPTLFVAV